MTNMTEHPSHGRTPDSGRDDAPAAFLWLLLGTWSLFLLFAGWMIGGHLPGTYVVAGALLLMLGLGAGLGYTLAILSDHQGARSAD